MIVIKIGAIIRFSYKCDIRVVFVILMKLVLAGTKFCNRIMKSSDEIFNLTKGLLNVTNLSSCLVLKFIERISEFGIFLRCFGVIIRCDTTGFDNIDGLGFFNNFAEGLEAVGFLAARITCSHSIYEEDITVIIC